MLNHTQESTMDLRHLLAQVQETIAAADADDNQAAMRAIVGASDVADSVLHALCVQASAAGASWEWIGLQIGLPASAARFRYSPTDD